MRNNLMEAITRKNNQESDIYRSLGVHISWHTQGDDYVYVYKWLPYEGWEHLHSFRIPGMTGEEAWEAFYWHWVENNEIPF